MTDKMNKVLDDNALGYLVLFTMPQVMVPYGFYTDEEKDMMTHQMNQEDIDNLVTLESISEESGIDTKYLPKRPNPRQVWEKVTSMEKKKVELSGHRVQATYDQFGTTPKGSLYTKAVKTGGGSSDMLVRHLVLEVTVGSQKTIVNDSVMTTAKNQRNNNTLVIMVFHNQPDNQGMSFVVVSDNGYGFLENDFVTQTIDSITEDINDQLGCADSQELRYGLRQYIKDYHGTMLANGSYFIPAQEGRDIQSELNAFKKYIDSLKPFSTNPDNQPGCVIYKVTPEGDAFSAAADLADSALTNIHTQMTELAQKAKEIQNKKKPHVQKKMMKPLLEEWAHLQRGLNVYSNMLGASLVSMKRDTENMLELMGILTQSVGGMTAQNYLTIDFDELATRQASLQVSPNNKLVKPKIAKTTTRLGVFELDLSDETGQPIKGKALPSLAQEASEYTAWDDTPITR